MKKSAFFLSAALASAAWAQTDSAKLNVTIPAFESGAPIPEKYAYCMPDGKGRTKDGGNTNPEIRWSGAPEGTKSYAILVIDPDVPASFELANQAGKTIPENFPRRDFYHWVLFDISATVTSIEEGRDSAKVVAGGKPIGKLAYGITGPNDFAKAYGGSYGGYDGPCPPWNDERLHHYHFIVYALDVETLGLSGPLEGKLVQDAIKGHVLASGEAMGTYTNHPGLVKK